MIMNFVRGLFGNPRSNTQIKAEEARLDESINQHMYGANDMAVAYEEGSNEQREWIYMGDGMMEEVIVKKEKVQRNGQIYTGRVTHTPVNHQNHSSSSRASYSDSPMIHTTSYIDSPSNTSCDTGGGFTCD